MAGRSGTGVNVMYRSVPPRPLSYTFSDVLQASLESRTPGGAGVGGGGSGGVGIGSGSSNSSRKRARSKTAPLTSNAAEEYAERFKSRPTTRPAVIDFDGFGVKTYTGCGGSRPSVRHPGHFPAASTTAAGKTRNVPPIPLRPRSPVPKLPQPLTERGTATTSSLQLAPLAKGTEPNSALSLQTKPFRHHPPPLPVHHHPHTSSSSPTKHSKTPDPYNTKRQQQQQDTASGGGGGGGGGRSAPSSVKSRGAKSSTFTTSTTNNTNNNCADGKSTATAAKSGMSSTFRGGTVTAASVGSSLSTPVALNGAWEDRDPGGKKLTSMDAMAFTMSPQVGTDPLAFPDVLTSSQDFDDLTSLPRPKRILPRRDLPWVFRFKVKKEMNALSKIMASKPSNGNSLSAAASSLG